MIEKDRRLFGVWKEDWFAAAAMLIFMCFLIGAILLVIKIYPSTNLLIAALSSGFFGTALAVLLFGCFLQQKRAINWIIRTAQWDLEKVKLHSADLLLTNLVRSHDTDIPDKRWPWGAHHTEFLGHLEAAAKKFWINYDPDDSGTAPTNEMVSGWLHGERKVSKDKARAIASILRADGVKTGPRT